ncbi:MAG: PEP-CTERM sorting domain-containing protein [Acidobacteria bacterium]|nr:PEP-CTERM sorting domain-containing protein [Acidobacteriota bacterium]
MPTLRRAVLALPLLLCAVCAHADTLTLDFEGLDDGSIVTTGLSSDVEFANTIALVAGGALLNEIDFPPASGLGVVAPDGGMGSITITFARPVVRLAGRFTYFESLALAAFDSSGEVASAQSLFTENLATGANAPNELIELVYAAGFSSVTIGSASTPFTLDDLELEFAAVTQVPEPAVTLLLVAGVATAVRRRR